MLRPELEEQFSMTSVLARVDGEPVSLLSSSVSSTFVCVNEQHVSLIIFTVLWTSGISMSEKNESNGMEWSGLD